VLANQSVANDSAAIGGLVARHGRPQAGAIEACCGASALADELILRRNMSICLAHPGYVARLKQSPDKTDFGDARLLADLCRVGYVPKVWLAPQETRQLRRLVRHRQQLVSRRRDIKLRIRALMRENRLRPPESWTPWTRAWLKWLKTCPEFSATDRWILDDHLDELLSLNGRIRAAERQLKEVTAQDPLAQKLLTYASVGLVTATTLRAEIGRFDRFRTGKQLANFCGVTPRNASSGARQADAGLVRCRNPQLRTALIELAHRLLHSRSASAQRWKELAHGMLRRGKPKNVVIAAVANRWIRWMFHDIQRPEETA
jgi:transposase